MDEASWCYNWTDGWMGLGWNWHFTGQLKKGLRLCGLLHTEVTWGSLPTSSLELHRVVQFLPFNTTDRKHMSHQIGST